MVAAIMLLSACKKDASCDQHGNVVLFGRWHVVSDSSFSNVGMNNHPVNYQGRDADYFDFRADSKLYTYEGGTFDTLHYALTSDTALIIDGFGIILNGSTETSFIAHLTAHTVTITAPKVITPGGVFGRKVNLDR